MHANDPHYQPHARLPLAWTITTSIALALLFALLLGTPLHEYAQTHATLPILFKIREATGHAPGVHPKLKIFAYDDTSFARQGVSDLPLATWADLLEGVAARKPRAVYIDKLFSLPPVPGE